MNTQDSALKYHYTRPGDATVRSNLFAKLQETAAFCRSCQLGSARPTATRLPTYSSGWFAKSSASRRAAEATGTAGTAKPAVRTAGHVALTHAL